MLCITINYLLEHLDKLGVRRKQERQVFFYQWVIRFHLEVYFG